MEQTATSTKYQDAIDTLKLLSEKGEINPMKALLSLCDDDLETLKSKQQSE